MQSAASDRDCSRPNSAGYVGFASDASLPDGLPQLAGAALDVEDVVDDLKRQAELGRVLRDRVDRVLVAAAHDGAAHGRGANQRAGLPRMHRAQPVGVERDGWPGA